jgi:hypothetical protein
MKAKTYALDDIIVVVMRGSGFTPLEQTTMDSGRPDRVIAMREDFQRVMAKRYKQKIEELTGREVLAFSAKRTSSPTSRWRCSSWTASSRASARSRSPISIDAAKRDDASPGDRVISRPRLALRTPWPHAGPTRRFCWQSGSESM